ncbi:hypothetical protein V8E55_008921, partial [Tylopilus felleus]
DVQDEHCGELQATRHVKKQNTKDLLTIFSDQVTVRFINTDGREELKLGRWCMVCKEDKELIRKFGKRKAFHVGGNLSCRVHICSHYGLYQERCAAQDILENHHAVPHDVLAERKLKNKANDQPTLDTMFPCTPSPHTFSREEVLRRVAQFIVCDDQASVAFRNCLVAMQPNATKADVPSSHDITTFIHNEFISFIKQLKVEIQSLSTGRVSTTMDLWSVDQTKASFLGITAHWITIDESSAKWSLRSQVIAFWAFSGAHTGENIVCYFVGLCER